MASTEALKEQMRGQEGKTVQKVDPNTVPVKTLLNQELFKKKFEDVLGARAPQFIASVINLVGNDKYLAGCNPISVISACLVAATLDLPIDKNLGYAWIVPYKEKGVPKAQFQMGYRGYVQLALRSGQYRSINVINVHEGELVKWDPLTEEMKIDFNQKLSDKVIGYAAYFELLNGFKKAEYWDMQRILEHKNKFSKSDFGWNKDFNAMARKTVLRNLLNHWGILSIQMQNGMSADMAATEDSASEAPLLITDDGEIIDLEALQETAEPEAGENNG
jgi:recombination protein RecT